MRLDTVYHDHAVRLPGVFVKIHRGAILNGPELHDLHRRKDRTAHGIFIDPIPFDDFPLAFRGRAAMASHGRHDERMPAFGLYVIHHALYDAIYVVYAAAAGSDRDPLILQCRGKIERIQLCHHFRGNVTDLTLLHMLTHAVHYGIDGLTGK